MEVKGLVGAPVIDITGTDQPMGYRQFHRDVSINFQCNRWAQWIGPSSLAEIAELASCADDYPQWITGFLGLAERARRDGRTLAGAYYDRAAEFFMSTGDPRAPLARRRFVETMQKTYEIEPDLVAFDHGQLPTYNLEPSQQDGDPIVVFGGFDSYVEEFFPLLFAFVRGGRRVVVFDGPGQGGALEDFGLAMVPDWERPVSAVLDHYQLSSVTAVGVSLGGALVIRAAAYEPRIARVVAFDICDDEFSAAMHQLGGLGIAALRTAIRFAPRQVVNAVARHAAIRKPMLQWALPQGMHITGTTSPYDFLRATTHVATAGCSPRVRADVLLLAGADDHYMPLSMLKRQTATLTHARSLTTRIFTAREHASNHCQIGNIGLAGRLIDNWIRETELTALAPHSRRRKCPITPFCSSRRDTIR